MQLARFPVRLAPTARSDRRSIIPPARSRELTKISLPDYIVEPPDILLVDAIRLMPKPPYRIDVLDTVQINVSESLPNEPISGVYLVEQDGSVNLGLAYGPVRVAGLTTDQARLAIENSLRSILKNPKVTVGLAQSRGLQQAIRGEHLVRPDGTISLGTYGCIYVAGKSLKQIKCDIERHLSQFLANPEVAVDVLGFNSKVYYVIFDGGGFGQQVFRQPITGNETVLDAISQVNGLPAVSSRKKIWVARPGPCDSGCYQVLPVNWDAITQGGSTCTNYQLLPGDRIFVKADPFIHLDNVLAKMFAPIERVLGITLLGSSVANSFRRNNNNNSVGVITGF